MKLYDVVIIGGGPAGAMSGIELQRKGFKTCIIEKSVFPREKLCGGLLTQKTIDILAKYCPDIPHEDFLVEKTTKIDFYYDYQKVNTFNTTVPYYFTDRITFDHLLIKQYLKEDGELIEETRIVKENINIEDNTVNVKNEIFQYKVLIGADGCNSVLMKKKKIPRSDLFSLEGKLAKEKNAEKELRIYFGCAKNGYGWYFPNKEYYKIGIGGENKNRILKKQADEFFTEIGSNQITDVKGAFIPSGSLLKYSSLKKNTLLVGDSAGFVDPISREGIYYALLSGVYAAQSIEESLNSKSDNFLKNYIRKTVAIRKDIRYALFFQKLLFYPSVLKFFMRFIQKHKSFATFYLESTMSTNQYKYINFIFIYFFKHKKYGNKN